MSRPLRVLLGVSGGIAAYKSVEIVRRLHARGHQVRCILSRRAPAFVAPLTLEVLSGHPVYQEEYLEAKGSGEELHITAAQWADVLCIAPTTANTLSRLALGLAGDFLSTTVLAFKGPLVLAPAMHPVMWDKEAILGHAATLAERGARIVGPVYGELASGEIGLGRMSEPDEIVAALESAAGGGGLEGRRLLITAGPTREPIDPVRYLSNRSSGKMGFALAAEAARRGARVSLVSGPVGLATPAGVERVDVETAAELREEVLRLAPDADLVLMAAAVADYRLREISPDKLKKSHGLPKLELETNPDILAELAGRGGGAVIVGFAAETGDLEAEARRKLEEKGVDYVVANDVSRSDIGFDSDHNEAVLYSREGEPRGFPRRSKRRLAGDLLDFLTEVMEQREGRSITAGS